MRKMALKEIWYKPNKNKSSTRSVFRTFNISLKDQIVFDFYMLLVKMTILMSIFGIVIKLIKIPLKKIINSLIVYLNRVLAHKLKLVRPRKSKEF